MAIPAPATARASLVLWTRIGWTSFGGPAGQISLMHRAVVEERGWVSEERFLHALSFCTLLPGPEAQQLATYLGWVTRGVRGGVVAGALFVVPGVLVMWLLSVAYVTYGDVEVIAAMLAGVQAAVIPIIVDAVLKVGRRALHSWIAVSLAAASFVAVTFLAIPYPFVVLAALAVGALLLRTPVDSLDGSVPELGVTRDQRRRALLAGIGAAVLWLAPVVVLIGTLGRDHVLTQEAVFFSKTALITFGGAYAVLGYVAQQAVTTYGWVTPDDMVTGLGLAETTPGPLILVVQFVGFLGAYNAPGSLPPLAAGTLGAAVTVWVTFLPCFMFIFLGAPYVERLRHQPRLAAALRGVTAAVVGVIASLALVFTLQVAFGTVTTVSVGRLRIPEPDWSTVAWGQLGIAAVAAVAVFRLRWGVLRTIGAAALLGLLGSLVG